MLSTGATKSMMPILPKVTPAEMIVTAALQEDVDVVGLSILSGAHMTLVPRVCTQLRERGLDDVLVTVEENVIDWVLKQARVVDKPVAFDELMGHAA